MQLALERADRNNCVKCGTACHYVEVRREFATETVCQVLALRMETKTLSLPDDGFHGLLKHVGGDFMHLLLYSNLSRVYCC